jgi:hypothetical protein
MNFKKKKESYLRVNLLGPGPSSYKKNYLPGRGLTKVGIHCPRLFIFKQTCSYNVVLCLGVPEARILECTSIIALV